MAEPHPLREEIQEAWGYTEYMRDRYDSFDEFIRKKFQECSHEQAAENYSDAALNLQQLAYKVYDKYNKDQ